MNSFALGKLAEIHIQSLIDGADESRKARRGTSRQRTPRRKGHFQWHKELGATCLTGAMTN
jgi:hypothetical protein